MLLTQPTQASEPPHPPPPRSTHTPRHATPLMSPCADSGKDQIERLLALGASRSEATADLVGRSVKLAMTPLLNQMSVVGLVSIPGVWLRGPPGGGGEGGRNGVLCGPACQMGPRWASRPAASLNSIMLGGG